MARLARAEVFDPAEVSVFHCINRCVRQCFLCGADPITGNNYEHRKAWIEQRLRLLAGCFGIDILGFSILSNHFHVILRNRPDVVATWSDTDVARRWYRLCPTRKRLDGTAEEPNEAELNAIRSHAVRLAEVRRRLSDISWFMRMVSEPVARRANGEDGCSGRFWQGRFKAVRLCDEAALLACSVYVDLNPIRAGLCSTPESSDHTSARRRIDARRPGKGQSATEEVHPAMRWPADWLAPLELDERSAPGPQACRLGPRGSNKGFLPMTLDEYLTLLDWTGRQVVHGKRGAISSDVEPILARLGIDASNWRRLATRFGDLFHRVAGSPCSVHREMSRRMVQGRRRRWYQVPAANLLGPR